MGSEMCIRDRFLFIQKMQNGWFFYPYHTSLISFEPTDILSQVTRVIKFLFLQQGRYTYTFVGLVLFLLLPKKIENKTLWGMALIIIAYISFDSLNYYLPRYSLRTLILGIIILVMIMHKVANTFAATLLCFLFGIVSYSQYTSEGFADAEDSSYQNYIAHQQNVSNYLEENYNYADSIIALFPISDGLVDVRQGYVKEAFEHVTEDYSCKADVLIINEPGVKFKNVDLTCWTRVDSVKNGFAKSIFFELEESHKLNSN